MTQIRLFTDLKRSVAVLLFVGFSVFLMQSSDMPALSFLSIGSVLFPVLMLIIASVGGIIPSIFSLCFILFGAQSIFSLNGIWLFAIYLVPITSIFLYATQHRFPFLRTVIAVFSVYLISVVVLYLLAQRASGGDLYNRLSASAIDRLDSMPQRDSILYTFWQFGLLSHGMEAGAQVFAPDPVAGWSFKPEVLSEFYKQISFRLSILAKSFIPGLMTTYSIVLSLLGTGFSIYLGRKQSNYPLCDMPPFSYWFIPRKWGKHLWGLAFGYLFAFLTDNPVLKLAGQMMYNVFICLFAVQGLSVLNYRMSKKKWRPFLRILLLVLLLVSLPPIPVIFGIIDQSSDSRNLRTKISSNRTF